MRLFFAIQSYWFFLIIMDIQRISVWHICFRKQTSLKPFSIGVDLFQSTSFLFFLFWGVCKFLKWLQFKKSSNNIIARFFIFSFKNQLFKIWMDFINNFKFILKIIFNYLYQLQLLYLVECFLRIYKASPQIL